MSATLRPVLTPNIRRQSLHRLDAVKLLGRLAAVLLALTIAPSALSQTCTTSWATAASGDWSVDGNWTAGSPDASAVACITQPGTYTVTLDRDQALDRLEIGGASGTQTLVLGGTFTTLGSGLIGPSGRVDIISSDNCTACDGLPLITGTLTVEGTLTHASGSGLLSTGGTVDIAPGGELLVDTGLNTVFGAAGASLFRIRGRMAFDPGNGIVRPVSLYGAIEVDGGIVAVTGGTVKFETDGPLHDASFDVSSGAELSMQDGHGSTGIYVATGTMRGDVQGEFRFRAGALSAGTGNATLNVSGNGLNASILSALSPFEFNSAGGEFVNAGLLRITTTANTLRATTITNTGTIRIDDAVFLLADDARIDNQADGVLDLVDSGQISGGPEGGVIENSGRIVTRLVDRISGTSSIRVPIVLDNGTVDAEGTRLDFPSQGIIRNTTFNVTTGGDINFANGGGSSGIYTVEGTILGNAEGTLRFSGVDVQAGVGDATLAVVGTGIRFRSVVGRQVVLSSAGGDFVNSGQAWFDGGQPEIRVVSFRNESALNILNVVTYLEDDGEIVNTINGTLNLIGTGSIRSAEAAPGVLVNEGLIIKTGGGTSSFGNRLRGQPGSEMRVSDGRYSLIDEAPENYGAGVRITGGGENGEVYSPLSLLMQGTISPGTDDDPVDTMRFPLAFSMASGVGDARLIIDLDADGGDAIRSEAGIRLGGTLVVRVRDGYTPTFGDAFTIVFDGANNAVVGAFDAMEVEGAPAGVSFVVDTSNRGSVVLRAVAAVAVAALENETTEGSAAAFVLTHPAADEPFSILFEVDGTATQFTDYTLGATRGVIRPQPNTTRTVVQLFPRRDVDASEGTEIVVLRLLPGNDASPVEGHSEGTISILDGPASDVLAIDAVVPARGGNLGTVTPTILGSGFDESTVVRLIGAATFESTGVEPADGGSGASAVFDLRDAPIGFYDVVVMSGAQTATLAGAFEVIAPDSVAWVWADIAGTTSPRNGRWSTYTVFLGNDTDADVYDVGLVLRITNGAEFEFLEGIQDFDNVPPSELELVTPGLSGSQVIPLWFARLAARSTVSFRVRVKPIAPLGLGDDLGVAYELYPPDNSNPFTWTGDIEESVPYNFGLLSRALETYIGEYPPANGKMASQISETRSSTSRLAETRFSSTRFSSTRFSSTRFSSTQPQTQNREPDSCPADGGEPPNPLGDTLGDQLNEGMLSLMANKFKDGMAIAPAVSLAAAGAGYETDNSVAASVVRTMQLVAVQKKRHDAFCSAIQQIRKSGIATAADACGDDADGGGDGGASVGPGVGGACGEIGGPHDPNEKFGPAGAGLLRFYDPAVVSTPYTVAFENLETASFPAQEVVVVDTLDTAVLDLATFSLGPIRWGRDHVITPPPGSQNFEVEIDLSPEIPAKLLVTASLDIETGRAVWYFATLDPATGDLPEDGTIGFLPPNVLSPEGEGSVTFTVRTRDQLPTGTTIANSAQIVFDVNEPILTPVWTNIIDVAAPISSVQSLAASGTSPVEITISGSDAGSGIQLYGLFASKDGSPFDLVQTSLAPTFSFEGEPGSAYGFYSVTSDFVHNTESLKTTAEAMTTITVGVEEVDGSLPTVLSLDAAYPNPTGDATNLLYGLPENGNVQFRVFDMIGREVRRISEESTAGWHPLKVDVRSFAAGVYTVVLEAGESVVTRRITVVR